MGASRPPVDLALLAARRGQALPGSLLADPAWRDRVQRAGGDRDIRRNLTDGGVLGRYGDDVLLAALLGGVGGGLARGVAAKAAPRVAKTAGPVAKAARAYEARTPHAVTALEAARANGASRAVIKWLEAQARLSALPAWKRAAVGAGIVGAPAVVLEAGDRVRGALRPRKPRALSWDDRLNAERIRTHR
jgi:hypothetical protein